MPSSATITSTDFVNFQAGQSIKSAEVNGNFGIYRGHFLPVEPNTSAAADNTYDLGSTEYKWRRIYGALYPAYRSVTTTDSPTTADDILACSGASFTITLPTAVGNTGKVFEILHLGTSLTQVYTLATTSSQTIGGIAGGSYALYTNGERLKIISDGSNWQILDHYAVTAFASYTPTFTGFGTVSTFEVYWRRQGDSIQLYGTFTAGTPTATEARMSLPSGVTSDTLTSIKLVAEGARSATSSNNMTVLIESSVTYVTFGEHASANPIAKGLANAIISAGEDFAFPLATIKVSGWQP